MKLGFALSLLLLFIGYFRADSQDIHQSLRSNALDLINSKNEHSCGENCEQKKNNRSLQDNTSSNDQSGSVGDIISDNMNNLYKDLATHGQEEAKNKWDSLSTGAKAGIIIAVVVVAIIIIAGIIHCLCICKPCCCC
ncbi:uncharacterized protein cubi_00896 [Cryptosporidium ubiquitum]|uniref:Uncharacterized protein n=1 Tax=Cryptosporidium ubiquitum TaxID=857276 RepID=A0A1J4M9S4_9CRYT|nr:uncharacterized protein cubi_00896 [Cryptosporidium ubiquitum]OII70751.1 hypothetical protein cubi_00896 [Cryptosporidium ubiquitum]